MKPIEEKEINGGTQRIYQFENGFGASVICNPFSYGGSRGFFELAVLNIDSIDVFSINYNTDITDDVIGYLKEEDVQDILEKIKEFPKRDYEV